MSWEEKVAMGRFISAVEMIVSKANYMTSEELHFVRQALVNAKRVLATPMPGESR